MKYSNNKLITAVLMAVILLTSPIFLLAQNNLSGQLVVSGNNFRNQPDFVTVNGESALSGRTVFSPSKIVTSPDANAKVILTKLGSTVSLAPGSAVSLSFDGGTLAGTVSAGIVTVQNIGQTKVNLTTPDGAVIFSSQPTSIQVSIIGGKTQVCAMDGEALFNNTRVVVGQTQCYSPVSNTPKPAQTGASGSASSGPNYLLFGLIGAAAAAAVVGLVLANGGGDDNSTTVSPTR